LVHIFVEFHQQRDPVRFDDTLDPALSFFIGNLGLVVEGVRFFSAFGFILFHVINVK
jgi:hypothetical protein